MSSSTFQFNNCGHSLCSFEFTTVNRGKVICHSDHIIYMEAVGICFPTVIISKAFVFIQMKGLLAQNILEIERSEIATDSNSLFLKSVHV